MRIQRWLAQMGIGSRRQIDKMISMGQITVNESPAELGMQLDGTERVCVEGKRIKLSKPANKIIMLNKPYGTISSRHDPDGRPTVYHLLPHLKHGQWQNVGRLDFATTGLMLFSTDGHAVERLTHPKHQIRRGYMVKCQGIITPQQIKLILKGVPLEDGVAKVQVCERRSTKDSKNTTLYMEVSEGRNRLIRRIVESLGLNVLKLRRVRFGPWVLPDDLPPGKTLEIHPDHWPSWLSKT